MIQEPENKDNKNPYNRISKSSSPGRRFLEVDYETANKIRTLCFLKNTTMKEFVTSALQRELEPYENWLENIKRLKQ